jgi:transcriptional regulator of heat shock response
MKEKILKHIIEEYINSATPVGSNYLVEKKKLDCCPATVRNTMMELERDGYLYQPHISAGRIPTVKAYKEYVNSLDLNQELSDKLARKLDSVLKKLKIKDQEQKSKSLAKMMAEITNGAVLLAFSQHNYYITGFSNIFSQPEFVEMSRLHNLSLALDNLENILERVFDQIKDTEVFVGEDNIFSEYLSAITSPFSQGVIGILGPTRMNYKRNLGLINYFKKAII